jgi:hypothetical protein
MLIGHTAYTGALRAGGATVGTAAIRRRHREPLCRPTAARSREEAPFEQGTMHANCSDRVRHAASGVIGSLGRLAVSGCTG